MVGIVGLIISIAVAVWIYQVVNKHGGKLPWLWSAGAFVFWPAVIIIVGIKYDEITMQVVGLIALGIIILGIVMDTAFLALP